METIRSQTVREVPVSIDDALWVKLVEFPSVFEMREYIKQTLVPEDLKPIWRGARLYQEDGWKYIIHMVDRVASRRL